MTSGADLAATIYAPPPALAPWLPASAIGHERLRFHSLARWSLIDAFRMAGAGPERPVLFPDFICREVLASAARIDAPVLFYRVGENLSPEDTPENWPKAAAVVAVDFFGFAQDLAPFEAYARRTGALVIEDAAHALFSRDGDGHPLGTRASLGVFSLRKSLTLPDGGALAVNDPALWGRVPQQAAAADAAAPELAFVRRRRALRRLLPLIGTRGMLAALDAARRVRGLLRGTHGLDPKAEKEIEVPPGPCLQVLAPITCVDPRTEAERRRSLYVLCADLLAGTGARPVFAALPPGTVPYVYPFRAEGAVVARAEAALRGAGLSSLPWPDLPDAVRPAAPEHLKTVRGAHFLW